MRVALGLVLGCLACSKPPESPTPKPVTSSTLPKLSMRVHTDRFGDFRSAGHEPAREIVETKGGGLALIDFDNDGDLDLFVPNGASLEAPEQGPGARMFENLGGLRFEDASARLGLSFRRWGQGVAVGDYDGDGFDDLYIACFGKDALLKNQAGRSFVEVTDSAQLGDPRWSTAAAFGDLDGDLDLDLYVVNYLVLKLEALPPRERYRGVEVFGGPLSLPPEADLVYENLGDGRFADRSASSGVLDTAPGLGLGTVILDFDGDGRQDIFVGNDSTPKHLFVNQGAWRFQERALALGLAVNSDGAAQATMGIAVADVNADRIPDLFTTNFAEDTNLLQVSRGKAWEDQTRKYKLGAISRPFLGWATHWGDLDLDGDEDLLVFNGHVYAQATRATMNSDYRQPVLCFERVGEAFERVDADWLAGAYVDRSAVFGDLDDDGDLDAIVAELHGGLRLYENLATQGYGLVVELEDARPQSKNRRALGARIEAEQAGRVQTRWIYSGGSYQAANPARAHFAWPSPGPVRLVVHWPDGAQSETQVMEPQKRVRLQHP